MLNEKIILRLSTKDKKTIVTWAEQNNVNVSALIRQLILDHIAKKKQEAKNNDQ